MPLLCKATENIDAYMSDIESFKRITTDQENELADRIHNGSDFERAEARDTLICANLKLVVKIAHDFKHCGLPFNDLVSEGNIGLMTAADKFDPSKGAKFSCYAAWWIKQAMRKALTSQSKAIRVPGGSAQRVARINKLKQSFVSEFDREPTMDELVSMTGYSAKRLQSLQAADVNVCSLSDTVKSDSKTTFWDMLQDQTDDEHVSVRDFNDALDEVRASLQSMSDLDRSIIESYGLHGISVPEDTICQETGLCSYDLNKRLSKIFLKLRGRLVEAGITM